MTVKELMELLERENPNAEVRMVFQRSYPLEYGVAGVASDAEVAEVEGGDCQEPGDDRAAKNVVYVVEGEYGGYGRRAAWDAARGR